MNYIFQLSSKPIEEIDWIHSDKICYETENSQRIVDLYDVEHYERESAISDLFNDTLKGLKWEQKTKDCYIYLGGLEDLAQKVAGQPPTTEVVGLLTQNQ